MIGFGSQARFCAPLLLLATLMTTGSAALAQDNKPSEVPICDKKIGTMSVADPEQKWWVQYNLESPEALIKVFVAQSKCFTLLDRGKGLGIGPAQDAKFAFLRLFRPAGERDVGETHTETRQIMGEAARGVRC